MRKKLFYVIIIIISIKVYMMIEGLLTENFLITEENLTYKIHLIKNLLNDFHSIKLCRETFPKHKETMYSMLEI